MNNPYISIGYNKGEMDFAISATVCELDISEMNELRAMIIVAIGTMEDMWRGVRNAEIERNQGGLAISQ